MSPETKEKAALVLFVAKKVFHWGFIPTVLYMGFKKGSDPGMPELSLLSLLWQ
uniref:Mitochondrial import receptor subunit TOM7 homolog n=1 Tax=Amblyomma maculatum TaxID=34609 RepID=G3MRJ7_AMBMU